MAAIFSSTRVSVKPCSICHEVKSFGEFYLSKGRLMARCKGCHKASVSAYQRKNREKRRVYDRRSNCKTRYGITEDQYADALRAQNGKCAICEKPAGSRALCVDHDHKTGAVRGLLCLHCNSMLGQADDDPERLMAAIRYLGVHGT